MYSFLKNKSYYFWTVVYISKYRGMYCHIFYVLKLLSNSAHGTCDSGEVGIKWNINSDEVLLFWQYFMQFPPIWWKL